MIRKFLQDERGASVIEVAVIIVIMVILAGVFQTQIRGVLDAIILKITTEINNIGTEPGAAIWFLKI